VEENAAGSVEAEAGIPIRERYGLVLGLLLLLYVLTGIDEEGIVTVVAGLVWLAVLLAILWSPGLPRRLRLVGGGAVLLVLVISMATVFLESDTADGLSLMLVAVAQLSAIAAIFNRIMRHPTVTLQTVMGGVAAYALFAFAMASGYHGLDLLTDAHFLDGVAGAGDYTYFSFVTLTTLGYGDITPSTEVAKRLAVVEAFAGQVFVITLVARLVSLWGKPLRR
jgi:voltage-gated potassium channel Kch